MHEDYLGTLCFVNISCATGSRGGETVQVSSLIMGHVWNEHEWLTEPQCHLVAKVGDWHVGLTHVQQWDRMLQARERKLRTKYGPTVKIKIEAELLPHIIQCGNESWRPKVDHALQAAWALWEADALDQSTQPVISNPGMRVRI